MRQCARCQTTYPPNVSTCPRDGESTREISTLDKNDPLIGKFVGSYRLTERLGVGGMGVVYSAEHPTLKKKVAVKLLHEEYSQKNDILERFFAEARLISALHHPNLVEVLDFGVLEDTYPYFVMEFLEGQTLKSLLRQKKRLPAQEAIPIVLQLLDALSVVHAEGIIHRDVKPDNVYLAQRRGELLVKLLDFGIAKLLDQKAKQEGIATTQTGVVIGTPQYMSPEQAQGHTSKIDERSDLYSVGVMLFEMVSGAVPFRETTFGELVIAHSLTPAPMLRERAPSCSLALESTLSRALSKKLEERFQNAAEMAEALLGALRAEEDPQDELEPEATVPSFTLEELRARSRRISQAITSRKKGTQDAGFSLRGDVTVQEPAPVPAVHTTMRRSASEVMTLPNLTPSPQKRRWGLLSAVAFVGLVLIAFAWLLLKPQDLTQPPLPIPSASLPATIAAPISAPAPIEEVTLTFTTNQSAQISIIEKDKAPEFLCKGKCQASFPKGATFEVQFVLKEKEVKLPVIADQAKEILHKWKIKNFNDELK